MSTYYTSKYSGEQIDEAVRKILDGEMTGDYADRQLSNLDTPQGALANLGAGVRPKITINPFFEINQRGQNTYTTNGYTVDGWKMGTNIATLTVEDDGVSITLNQAISSDTRLLHQIIENPEQYVGKTLTFTFLIKSVTASGFRCGYRAVVNGSVKTSYKNITDAGIYEISWEVESGVTEILFNTLATSKISNGAKCSIIAGTVEVGDTQTLAYQDDTGAWQLLPQPESDYATQLAKCQRHYARYGIAAGNSQIGYVMAVTSTIANATIFLPGPMRITNPTVRFGGTVVLRSGATDVPVSGMTINAVINNAAHIQVTASGLESGKMYVLRISNGYIAFDADL